MRGSRHRQRRGLAVGFVLAALVGGPVPAARAQSVWLFDGFEHEINWGADTASAATGRVVDAEQHTEGGHALKLLYKSVAKGGRAIYWHYETLDWSPYGALLLDVYNPASSTDLVCSVVLSTTDNFIAHEYFLPPLHPGWNRDLRVPLTGYGYSSPATDYKPVGFLVGRNQIQMIQLVVYPAAGAEGSVDVDNLRLERQAIVAMGDATLNTTLDARVSGGTLDYVPPDMRLREQDFTPLEDFEGPVTWTTGQPDVVLEAAHDKVAHGSSALSVSFPANPDGFDIAANGLATRLAGAKQLRMAIYCTGPWLNVALNLTDTDGNVYTNRTWMGHGWNTPVFDFTNQNAWTGGTMTPAVLTRLSAVTLTISSRTQGRLVFDSLEVAGISLAGAAKAGATLNFSYHPGEAFDLEANERVEDTAYGSAWTAPRSAAPQAFLESARARWDAGALRTGLLYREKITQLDNPIYNLVDPSSLGNEIAALQTSGRAGPAEFQVIGASRIAYDTYNSRVPTGFGPDHVIAIRARDDLGGATRLGVTQFTHLTRYGDAVTGLPRARETYGTDLESHVDGAGWAVQGAVEGGATFGDTNPTPAGAPEHDRGYVAVKLAPTLGRLKVTYQVEHFGYDFDADYTSDYGNWDGQDLSAGFNLEHLGPFRALDTLGLYDNSVGSNLTLAASGSTWNTRDRYQDPLTEAWKYRQGSRNYTFKLGNDEKAKPNVQIRMTGGEYADQWTSSVSLGRRVSLRVPLVWGVILSGRLDWNRSRTHDLTYDEHGYGWSRDQQVALERYFKTNLFVHLETNWTQSHGNWEGAWGDPSLHAKFSAQARQVLGPNTTVELHYGEPALLGADYGLQDTIDVWTAVVRSTF